MQVLTNQGFVKTRRRLGTISTLLGFGALAGGLFLSWQNNELVILAYAALLPGYLLIMFGSYATLRWGTKPRVDEALAGALKSLDHKYQLFNYIKGIPVENLLLTPTGLTVLETRPYMGDFRNVGEKWQRKRSITGWLLIMGEGPLRNPTQDAERGIVAMRAYLRDRLGPELADQVPVDGAVVFTHPAAKLTVENPKLPVTQVSGLKGIVRRPQGKSKLQPDVYRRLAQALRPASADQPKALTAPAGRAARADRRSSRSGD